MPVRYWKKGGGPYFYHSKLEHYKEALAMEPKYFLFSQNYCDILSGTIKATVLVETILAPFSCTKYYGSSANIPQV